MTTAPRVVGVCGSDGGLPAVDWTVDEAARHGLPLRLLHGSLGERYEGPSPRRSVTTAPPGTYGPTTCSPQRQSAPGDAQSRREGLHRHPPRRRDGRPAAGGQLSRLIEFDDRDSDALLPAPRACVTAAGNKSVAVKPAGRSRQAEQDPLVGTGQAGLVAAHHDDRAGGPRRDGQADGAEEQSSQLPAAPRAGDQGGGVVAVPRTAGGGCPRPGCRGVPAARRRRGRGTTAPGMPG